MAQCRDAAIAIRWPQEQLRRRAVRFHCSTQAETSRRRGGTPQSKFADSQSNHMKSNRFIWLVFFAAVGMPVLFSVYTYSIYRLWLNPDLSLSPALQNWLWILAYGTSILGGAYCAWKAASTFPYKRILVATYVLVMTFVLMLLNLKIACGMGDCL